MAALFNVAILFLILTLGACKTEKGGVTQKVESEGKLPWQTEIKEDSYLKEGDLVFQQTDCEPCRAIQLATRSNYSHMGLLVYDTARKEWMVFEAGRTVRLTPLKEWEKQGVDEEVVVMRLRERKAIIDSAGLETLRIYIQHNLHKPYDMEFRWDDSAQYCSELVYKAYDSSFGMPLGEPRPLSDYDLNSSLVQKQLEKRYAGKVPFDEPMISPMDMLQNPALYRIPYPKKEEE